MDEVQGADRSRGAACPLEILVEIKLMAVSKTFAPELIRETYAAGIHVFGESRVQEFSSKFPFLTDLKGAEWHMIATANKQAAKAVELFNAIDSVDSFVWPKN